MADYNINAVTRRVVFTGSAGLGPYAFTFEILDEDDLAVYFNATKLTKTTDYTVTINANGTGSITIVTGSSVPSTPDANDTIIILGARDIERVTDFVTAGDLLASSLNEQLDALTIFDQQVAEEQKRSLQAPVYDPAHVDDGGTLDMTLPTKADRLNKTLAFNATTGNPEAGPTVDEVSNAQTYATNASTSATAAAASATSASGSAATATTKAAEASTSAAAAAASETASAASETASAASETASAASEAASASSASSASTSAATATTKAGEASTSASNASTSETNAATSETNAASSASAAAASQTAAAASAASAASAYDSFDDRYLGVKASDPTVDNDGDPLSAGLLYFSSSENIMKVYDGASWIAATSAGNVSLTLYEYTATSGQTTFSGADDNAATLSYTVNNIQVVMNGIVLDPSDFTATNGTSVVLATGAALNDIVNIYAFKSFTVADTVSASAGGTFSGNVTVNALLNVDNLRLDGNTISSTDTNGNLTLDPDGTGDTIIASGNVGIGTSTVDSALHIEQDASGVTETSGSTLKIHNTNASGRSKISLHNSAETASGSIYYDTDVGGLALQGDTGAIVTINTAGNNERMRITSVGDLLHGTTVAEGVGYTLQYNGGAPRSFFNKSYSGTGTAIYFMHNGGVVGSITYSNTATAYLTSSDYRLKENVADMTGAIDRVKALAPKRFNFIAGADTTVDGFLAHEAQAVVPEAVTGTHNEVDEDGNAVMQGIDQSKLVPLLTGALQEAIAKIETLETKVATLEAGE